MAWIYSHFQGKHPKKPRSNKKHHIYIYNNTNTFIKFQLSCCFYLCTRLACSWPWWPNFFVHQSTTSAEHLSRDALWLIWYLQSAHLMHALALSCVEYMSLCKKTQPINWVYWFELPHTPIWPNRLFCKWNRIIF